eukprot:TRINITY_DN1614_c0_g1_i1.p1 TRINITY_DN1614_c0_g1~~TRINITY_DN1614_c0_g1_i1.p1  ORF type:complete len:829 (-),score=213.26 TRINITY_DN1614_c0_g1_i1:200-2686(-)
MLCLTSLSRSTCKRLALRGVVNSPNRLLCHQRTRGYAENSDKWLRKAQATLAKTSVAQSPTGAEEFREKVLTLSDTHWLHFWELVDNFKEETAEATSPVEHNLMSKSFLADITPLLGEDFLKSLESVAVTEYCTAWSQETLAAERMERIYSALKVPASEDFEKKEDEKREPELDEETPEEEESLAEKLFSLHPSINSNHALPICGIPARDLAEILGNSGIDHELVKKINDAMRELVESWITSLGSGQITLAEFKKNESDFLSGRVYYGDFVAPGKTVKKERLLPTRLKEFDQHVDQMNAGKKTLAAQWDAFSELVKEGVRPALNYLSIIDSSTDPETYKYSDDNYDAYPKDSSPHYVRKMAHKMVFRFLDQKLKEIEGTPDKSQLLRQESRALSEKKYISNLLRDIQEKDEIFESAVPGKVYMDTDYMLRSFAYDSFGNPVDFVVPDPRKTFILSGIPPEITPRQVRSDLISYLTTYNYPYGEVTVERAETFLDKMHGLTRGHCIVTLDSEEHVKKIFECFGLFGIHVGGYRCSLVQLKERLTLWAHIPNLPNRSTAWREIRRTGIRGVCNVVALLDPDLGTPTGNVLIKFYNHSYAYFAYHLFWRQRAFKSEFGWAHSMERGPTSQNTTLTSDERLASMDSFTHRLQVFAGKKTESVKKKRTRAQHLFEEQYKQILTALWDHEYDFSRAAKQLGLTVRDLKNSIVSLSRVGFAFDLPADAEIQMKIEIPQVPEYLAKYYLSDLSNGGSSNNPDLDEFVELEHMRTLMKQRAKGTKGSAVQEGEEGETQEAQEAQETQDYEYLGGGREGEEGEGEWEEEEEEEDDIPI